jgi:hypothetical protein
MPSAPQYSSAMVAPSSARRVTTRVHACIGEFELVYVRSPDGMQYALTPDTTGIRLSDLQEGQAVECLLSNKSSRVLSARLVA